MLIRWGSVLSAMLLTLGASGGQIEWRLRGKNGKEGGRCTNPGQIMLTRQAPPTRARDCGRLRRDTQAWLRKSLPHSNLTQVRTIVTNQVSTRRPSTLSVVPTAEPNESTSRKQLWLLTLPRLDCVRPCGCSTISAGCRLYWRHFLSKMEAD